MYKIQIYTYKLRSSYYRLQYCFT